MLERLPTESVRFRIVCSACVSCVDDSTEPLAWQIQCSLVERLDTLDENTMSCSCLIHCLRHGCLAVLSESDLPSEAQRIQTSCHGWKANLRSMP